MDKKHIDDLEQRQSFTHHHQDTLTNNAKMRLRRMQNRSFHTDVDKTRKIVRNHLKLTAPIEDTSEKDNQEVKNILRAYTNYRNR